MLQQNQRYFRKIACHILGMTGTVFILTLLQFILESYINPLYLWSVLILTVIGYSSYLLYNLVIWKRNMDMEIVSIERLNLLISDDISKHKSQLEYLACYDALTALPNRKKLKDIMEEAILETGQENGNLAIAFIGIDNFKKINDTVGHKGGDEVLGKIGQRLASLENGNFSFARFAGDEFVLIIRRYESKENLTNQLNEVRDIVRKPFTIHKNTIYTDVSIGVALYPENSNDIDTLLQYADTAMFHAKQIGKLKIIYFENDMSFELNNRFMIEERMNTGIEDNCFQLYYQPQYDFEAEKLRGFEALIRWYDPDLGWISPTQFIPIAEETGKIVEIGHWVLREACKTWASWKEEFGQSGKVSVNVSAIQLTRPDFPDFVEKILLENNMNPGELELEITESVFINNMDDTVRMLERLRQLGVSISLDDFGTGYSSLTYLKDLPINTLKIDRSFICNIHENNRQREIADALIDMVHRLKIETIAEGVETKEQFDFLKYMKCDNMQGFLKGRPMDRDSAAVVIQKHSYA